MAAEQKRFPIQNVGFISWELAERAYAVYAARHGTAQSLERLAERGGFGLVELGQLLSPMAVGSERRAELAAQEILKAEKAALDACQGALAEMEHARDHAWREILYEQQRLADAEARLRRVEALTDPKVPVPPTIATDDEFRDIYSQAWRHAMADVRAALTGASTEGQ